MPIPFSDFECEIKDSTTFITEIIGPHTLETDYDSSVVSHPDGGRCVVETNGVLRQFLITLSDHFLRRMSDSDIINVVRGGYDLGMYLISCAALKEVVENTDSDCDLLTLQDIKSDCAKYQDYLSDYLLRDPREDNAVLAQCYKDAATTLRHYEDILAGRDKKSGFIYCLSDQQGHYKIGMSKNLDRRISQLATQPPFEIVVIASHQVYDMRKYEAALHWLHADKRLRGEWFSLDEPDIEDFKSGRWLQAYLYNQLALELLAKQRGAR